MNPYERITWRGHRFNRRTVTALKWVEKHSGLPLEIAQGSYNTSVGASGNTHAGGGAVDLRVRQYTAAQRRKVVRYLKKAGFAAWYRREVPGLWGPHIHAILMGDRQMSVAAQQQVQAFLAGRDGLSGNRTDNTFRTKWPKRFSMRKNRPVRQK